MPVDITRLTLPELKTLRLKVEKRIQSYEEDRRREAAAALQKHAKELGFDLASLTGGARKSRAPAAPKYRDPATGQTWSGRGRQPVWFRDALKAGVTPESMGV